MCAPDDVNTLRLKWTVTYHQIFIFRCSKSIVTVCARMAGGAIYRTFGPTVAAHISMGHSEQRTVSVDEHACAHMPLVCVQHSSQRQTQCTAGIRFQSESQVSSYTLVSIKSEMNAARMAHMRSNTGFSVSLVMATVTARALLGQHQELWCPEHADNSLKTAGEPMN